MKHVQCPGTRPIIGDRQLHCSFTMCASGLRLRLLFLVALGVYGGYADWPEFRGPWGNGQASPPGDTKLVGFPLHWSEASNVVWKTEIPYRGWSTPVVMDGQVW